MFTSIAILQTQFFRINEKSEVYVATNLAHIVSILVFTLLFAMRHNFNLTVEEAILARLFGKIIFLLATMIFTLQYKYIKFSFSKKIILRLIKSGLLFIPVLIVLWGMDYSDRYLLNFFLTQKEVGIYSMAYGIGLAILLPIMGFHTTWVPHFLSIKEGSEKKDFASKTFVYLCAVLISVSFVLSVFAKEIISIIGPKYMQAYQIVPIITLSYLFYGFYRFFLTNLYVVKKISNQLIITSLALFINVIVNVILIPLISIFGAAVSTFIAYSVLFIFTYYVSQRNYVLQMDYSRIGWVFAVFLTHITLYLFVDKFVGSTGFSLLTKVILIFSFLYLLSVRIKEFAKLWHKVYGILGKSP
jgi:O-antigen/teichoic acid export membrane protein